MTALIIVDPQNDFCEGGPLGVGKSKQIFPIINNLKKSQSFQKVFMTLDWHPLDHVSFSANHGQKPFTQIQLENGVKQILWPTHCVQDTPGSSPSEFLELSGDQIVVKKGYNKHEDSYSGFGTKQNPTELKQKLSEYEIKDVYVVGLALDYCVGNTAIDAKEAGFNVWVIEECTKPVAEETGKKMLQSFKNLSINYKKVGQIQLKI